MQLVRLLGKFNSDTSRLEELVACNCNYIIDMYHNSAELVGCLPMPCVCVPAQISDVIPTRVSMRTSPTPYTAYGCSAHHRIHCMSYQSGRFSIYPPSNLNESNMKLFSTVACHYCRPSRSLRANTCDRRARHAHRLHL